MHLDRTLELAGLLTESSARKRTLKPDTYYVVVLMKKKLRGDGPLAVDTVKTFNTKEEAKKYHDDCLHNPLFKSGFPGTGPENFAYGDADAIVKKFPEYFKV